MKPTLLVLAAGMGSRYGGLKQLDGVGPTQETIMEFSIYDAIQAGFGKVVFVIRESFEEAFKERFNTLFEDRIEIAYAFQDINISLEGIDNMPERTKPWGTAHAVLAAKNLINEPFAVINADDYYGQEAYQIMADFLINQAAPDLYSMIGYSLGKTISDHGTVNRGVCKVDENNFLTGMVERIGIERFHQYIVFPREDKKVSLPASTLVSMNFFGFHHSIFDKLATGFEAFVRANYENPKSEYYIPLIVNELINNGTIKMAVLPTDAVWYGVTYQEDRPTVVAALQDLTDQGQYISPLWQEVVVG